MFIFNYNQIKRRSGRKQKKIMEVVVIKFSHHAKRRGKLYNISEEIVRKILEGKDLIQGKKEIIEEIKGFRYPLKIVISVEEDMITVITNYPLKKGLKNESLL